MNAFVPDGMHRAPNVKPNIVRRAAEVAAGSCRSFGTREWMRSNT